MLCQDIAISDTTDLPPHSIRLIATVKHADADMMVIIVEHLVTYTRGATTAPETGSELTVRLPGRNKPETNSRIEVDLKEKLDVGAMPSSYIMLGYRTIE